jgi:hypothetical protein
VSETRRGRLKLKLIQESKGKVKKRREKQKKNARLGREKEISRGVHQSFLR